MKTRTKSGDAQRWAAACSLHSNFIFVVGGQPHFVSSFFSSISLSSFHCQCYNLNLVLLVHFFFVDFLFLFSTNLVILMIVGKSLLIKYFRSSTWKSTNRYLATAKNNAIAATMWFLFYLAAFDGSRKKQITENCSRLLGSRWPEQEVAKKTTINCYTIFSEKNEWPETEDKREQSFCLLSMEIR